MLMNPNQWCILWTDGHVSLWPAAHYTEDFIESIPGVAQCFPVY